MKATGRIAFLCPDYLPASGGIRVIYRHVDILNAAGIPAVVIHGQRGFRCGWFENRTSIVYAPEVRATDFRLLVIPEIYGPKLHESIELERRGWFWNQLRRFGRLAPLTRWRWDVRGVKKVIFNQNAYLTFQGYPLGSSLDSPYLHQETVATVCVSDDSEKYLRSVFPDIYLRRLFYSIDSELFHPRERKKKQICFMPRKNLSHVIQVIESLRLRGNISDYELVSIEGKTVEEVAKLFRQSRFFLSFGYPEGFSFPPMEAMAAGAIVIGYHGNGGLEYFDPRFTFSVPFGDIMGFVAEVERLVALDRCDSHSLDVLAVQASKFVSERYRTELEEQGVVDFYRGLLELKIAEAA